MIRRCYPFGKLKAFNVSYDDGVQQDVRFVVLLNKYGLKGTFNLNSQLMEQEFEWVHDSGMTVKRLSMEAASHLYDGHEIASHTLTHPYMHEKSEAELLREIGEDKRQLERFFGREVVGFGVPFDYYSDQIAQCVKQCGFEYGRRSEETRNYCPWQDRYNWRCGIFHLSPDLDAYVDGFFNTSEELALCQIVGHSYDLDVVDLWGKIENIFKMVSENEDILPMTHMEIVRYIRAMEQAVITGDSVQNLSDQTLWFRIDDTVCALEPGQTI